MFKSSFLRKKNGVFKKDIPLYSPRTEYKTHLRTKIMQIVFLTALGVGGATIIGALIGFIFKNISHKFSDIVLGFAAGIMLAAAVIGLIIPSLEYNSPFSVVITVGGTLS